MQVGRVGGAVEHEIAVGRRGGQVKEVLTDPLVKGVALRLDPIVDSAPPGPADRGRDIDDDRQVGEQPCDRPVEQVPDLRGTQVPAGPLVSTSTPRSSVGRINSST